MSVIAKMNISSIRGFGWSNLVKLSCVYENDGLNGAGYEDRRFTKATPWGEGDISTPQVRGFEEGKAVYLVFNKADDLNDLYRPLPDALLSLFVTAKRIEPWPGSKQVEFATARKHNPKEGTDSVSLRLAIDNPAASGQFEEGGTYYLSVYSAEQTTLHEAAAGA